MVTWAVARLSVISHIVLFASWMAGFCIKEGRVEFRLSESQGLRLGVFRFWGAQITR